MALGLYSSKKDLAVRQERAIVTNQRVNEFKKGLILETAYNLFMLSRYETVTVEDIAREAGFGKSTLYALFESKDEILVSVVRMGLEKLGDDTRALLARDGSFEDIVNSLIKLRFDFYCRFGRLLISLGHRRESGNIKEEWQEELRRIKIEQLDLIAKVFDRGIAEGLVVSYDPVSLARILDGIIKGFCFSFLGIEGKPPSSDQDVEALKYVIFNGIMLKGAGGE